MKRSVSVILAVAGTCSVVPALAGPVPAMRNAVSRGAGGADALFLSNNVVGDGHLDVTPDAYGAYQNGYPGAGNGDNFDPPGPEPALTPMFASAWYVFGPATQDRAVLAEATSSFPANYPGTFQTAITSAQAGSDFDGDGVTDTSSSAFTIVGGTAGINVSATMLQRVSKPAGGVSRFRQALTLTNNGAAAVSLKVMKHVDMDIFATPVGVASWADVAGSIDAAGCQPTSVYEREPLPAPANTPIAFGLSSTTSGYAYYAGRTGYDPDGAGPDPPMDYGTDFEIWNAYGLPLSWENQTAFVGAAPLTGEDPNEFPVGGIAPNDGFMGYQWTVNIPAGGQATFNVVLSYGSRSDYACYPDCNCDGALTVADFGCFQTSFVAASGYGDCNGDGVRTVADFGCFQTRFVQGCN